MLATNRSTLINAVKQEHDECFKIENLMMIATVVQSTPF
jgi:hypothetical protein